MPFSREYLLGLVQNPGESLSVELKSWLDPESQAGRAKIAKACIALRNENGGCIIFGIDDDGNPNDANAPADVRATFHIDIIQHICSRSVSKPFPVAVEFIEHANRVHPVICVPSGVETPVASRQRIDVDDATLLAADTVYVRSINRGVVSSTPAGPSDWDKLAKTCFDNREADIGAFVRRHLQGANLESLGAFLNVAPPGPTPAERARAYLDTCRERFQRRWDAEVHQELAWGTREASIVLIGEVPHHEANVRFFDEIMLRKPKLSGWGPWLDSRHFGEPQWRANVVDNGWEALIAGEPFGPKIDYWRIEPNGRFYCIRVLENDLSQQGLRRIHKLDLPLEIGAVAEIVATSRTFALSMDCDAQTSQLAVAMRWAGLERRWLFADGNRRNFCGPAEAAQHEITTDALIPLEVPETALAPWVEQILRPLFALFGGAVVDPRTIEEIVTETIQGRY